MARKAQASKKRTVFRFMDLPPELREMIYEALLVRGTLTITRGSKKGVRCAIHDEGRRRRFLFKNGTSILRVGKEVTEEALPVLYGKNKFEFAWQPALVHFFRHNARNAALVKEVVMPPTAKFVQAIRSLHIIENLKSLEIRLNSCSAQERRIDVDCAALQKFVARKSKQTEQADEAGKITFNTMYYTYHWRQQSEDGRGPTKEIAWSHQNAPMEMKKELLRRMEHPKSSFNLERFKKGKEATASAQTRRPE